MKQTTPSFKHFQHYCNKGNDDFQLYFGRNFNLKLPKIYLNVKFAQEIPPLSKLRIAEKLAESRIVVFIILLLDHTLNISNP